MNYNNLCLNCFYEKNTGGDVCPKCGFSRVNYRSKSANCLPLGTLLHKNYVVGVPLGIGGFGITYLCFDISIGGICAVKEYMLSNVIYRTPQSLDVQLSPNQSSMYQYGSKRFRAEAELLKKFKNRSIINVYDMFSENKTHYYVMEYCNGQNLGKYTHNFKNLLNVQDTLCFLTQILDALEVVHRAGVLHRDIAPDNIFVTSHKQIKLLDFGSARYEMEQNERNLSRIVKGGYTPPEQHGNSIKQGPYTDIYSLGATFYHLLTGKIPPLSIDRVVEDRMVPLQKLRPDLPPLLAQVLNKAMAVHTRDRFATVTEMKRALLPLTEPQRPSPSPAVAPPRPAPSPAVAPPRPSPSPAVAPPRPAPSPAVAPPRPSPSPAAALPKSGSAPKVLCATFSQRLVAKLIDKFIELFVWAALWIVSFRVFLFPFVPGVIAGIVLYFLFSFVWSVAFEASPLYGSLGKAIYGLYLADRFGRPLGFKQIVKRNLVKFPGSIAMLFQPDREPLQDRMTSSHVLCK